MPPGVETFDQIAISATMLVATTNEGMCHVLTLADEERQSFRLAFTSGDMITAVGGTVAILYMRSQEDSTWVEATIWTLESRSSVQCCTRLQELLLEETPGGDLGRHVRIMLGTNTDYLVLFERHSHPPGFHFTRLNLDGEIHSRGSLNGPDSATFSNLSESLVLLDVGGCVTIWFSFYCRTLIRIQYEPQKSQLQLKTNHTMSFSGLTVAHLATDPFFWKNAVYYRDRVGSMSKLKIFNLSNNRWNYATNMGFKDDSRFF